ncbi:MAG: hypothetical protein H6799_00130 [Candidatus Nomurabacteria bacterium]|nr:MAG: hypothetical protein H6799_00130 [Candidatus Nomurabacteria bacterium]HRV76027.1 hypothetical protein [Candidatus Saccharimonadales bacterium]
MTNLRQEVTVGAREFNVDTTPTCPYLSPDPHVRGKQVRAVALSRMFDPDIDLEIPFIDLNFSPYTPLNDFSRDASAFLVEHIERTLEELEEDDESPAAIYIAGPYEECDDEDLDTSSPVDDTIENIRVFINSAVEFTAENIYMFALDYSEMCPDEIYTRLRNSYGGVAKKFTGGKSVQRLELASRMITKSATSLAGELVLDKKDTEALSFRTSPHIVGRAIELAEKTAKDEPHLRDIYTISDEEKAVDRPGVCPGSIDVVNDGSPVVAEKVWQWTIDVARESQLIEALRY